MKKLLVVIAALIFSSVLFAQKDMDKKTMTHSKKTMHHSMMHDCVMMEDGQMMMMKNGKSVKLDHEVTMKNGMVCMPDGTCKMKDGTTMTMKDGEMCTMNGKMSKMKMDKSMKMKM